MNEGDFIIGRNSVREAIKTGEQIDKLMILQGAKDGSIVEILALAREHKVVVQEVPRMKLDEICAHLNADGRIANHQGVVAQIPAFRYSEMEDIFALADLKGEKPFIIILDGIQDPHNLGAIIRSGEALGAHGVIIGKRRCAMLSSAAYKVSSGAVQYIPIVKVTNINQTISELKKQNIWVAGTDTQGQEISKSDLSGALAIVIGNEGEGLSQNIKENCDFCVKIDMPGKTTPKNKT